MSYVATVTMKRPTVLKFGQGIGAVLGTVDISTYHASLEEITDITANFRSDPIVTSGGLSDNGFQVAWSTSDNAFKAYYPVPGFTPKPIMVVEEVVAVSGDDGTLAHLPAYVIAIEATTGNTTGAKQAIPTGEAPSTKECAITFTTGGLVFNTTDAVTVAKVTYFPQRNGTMFAASNMVIDEVVAVDVGNKQTLNNQAACIQYVYNVTNTAPFSLEPVGEAPTATGNAVVDIDAGSDDTDIDFHADDDSDSVKVTYLKYSGTDSPAITNLGDGDVDLAGDTAEQLEWGPDELRYGQLLMPGFGTIFVGETSGNANVTYPWSPASISAGAGVVTIDPVKHKVTTDDGTAITVTTMPWLIIDPAMLTPQAVTAAAGSEVGNGVDVGVVNFIAFGVVN